MIRRHEPLDIDAAVIRMAGQVDRLQHALSDLAVLRADVDTHSRSITDLADVLRRNTLARQIIQHGHGGDGAEGEVEQVPPAEWLSVTDPEDAITWLCEVDQWTRDVWCHYSPLTVCWPWHPHVVAELLTCKQLWAEATAPGAGAGGLGAWHDRWRPGAAHRIARALTACERTDGSHVTGPGATWTVDATRLDELALWWATTHSTTHVTTHGGGPHTAPGLTKEERR